MSQRVSYGLNMNTGALCAAACPAQAVVQALELHGAYHIGVEFTRALRDGVKQLLRTHKLPEVRQQQLAFSVNSCSDTEQLAVALHLAGRCRSHVMCLNQSCCF